MYAALEVHTTKTIAAGHQAVQKFSILIKVCMEFSVIQVVDYCLEIY
jgi:hypothetical protein